ncbi:MAG TPA: class III extradiol ring-cleavage dioxygenase [Polyangiaceae bacterium]|jgi:4,5-DOPA dioxygenase extradiol
MISRRQILAFGAALAASRRAFADESMMPTGYVGHGSPLLATDPVRSAELRAWGRTLPRASGIVTITPHYRGPAPHDTSRLRIGHVGRGRALRSFPAFMDKMVPRDLDYPSPDNTALAHVVADLLAPLEPTFDTGRGGFDHTTWMPLLHLYPGAPAPVVELAMPFASDAELFSLGRRLAPLRRRGVFILASGSMTHNLASIGGRAPTPWAEAFDAWAKSALASRDVASLIDWRARAPNAELAHPDDGGHFRVLLVALGAVAQESTFSSAIFPVEGFEGGTQSKRCVELA